MTTSFYRNYKNTILDEEWKSICRMINKLQIWFELETFKIEGEIRLIEIDIF